MTEEERAALAALRLTWAPVPDDVWRHSDLDVDGLHAEIIDEVLGGVADASVSDGPSPIGLVMRGRRGSGKTHLLGWVRRQVHQRGGYFFLVGLLDEKQFWPSVLADVLDGLARPVNGSDSQLRLLLRRLSAKIGAPRAARRAVMGETGLTHQALDAFVTGLYAFDSYVGQNSGDTARALALRASGDLTHRDVAENYFVSGAESLSGERADWGIRPAPRTAEDIVREISLLLALTGPTVIAVDQIDTLVQQSSLSSDRALNTDAAASRRQSIALEKVAGGLMNLRQRTRRTMTMVACLPHTWTLIEEGTTDTVQDRFRVAPVLKGIVNPGIAREIVRRRFAVKFGDVGFEPDYATWPIRDSAFDDVRHYTPRRLLMEIDNHIRGCLKRGIVTELVRFDSGSDPDFEAQSQATPVDATPQVPDAVLDRLDARFEKLKRTADVTSPMERETEDATFPALLAAGLTAWILERGVDAEAFTLDPPPSANPDLHARLRRTLDEETEDQVHWSFRAVSDTHHGNGALNRIKRASTAAGLASDVSKRKLFLIRNRDWSTSAKTQHMIRNFQQSGGLTLPVEDADLRGLASLHIMQQDEKPNEMQAWLVRRRPAAQISLFKEALSDADDWTPTSAPPKREPVLIETPPELVIGHAADNDEPVALPLEALRKHVAVFAASGSGKTVLIRRVIEDCALQGVSAIVLDPNNDMAQLGDAWPEPPAHWRPGDAERAADYLDNTEVVVWTPRREAGRPLSFQPLPDFATVRDDPDEFGEAVEAAVAALAPRAKLIGRTNKAHLGLAVLRRTVEFYGRQGGHSLEGLIATLGELPGGISGLQGADRIAAELAQTLTASMDNDPMFGGTGAPADPGLLLTPSAGKRARISVISLIGLKADEARQSFVNQLQMALFAWIKKNPATDRPLLGLFVMDEAATLAPSGAMTACTQSTLALASQARKYGLGLLFATQAPKSLHNRIPGNATTQFFGALNVNVQVEAAREMARVKGGDVPDISMLRAGEFYVALEGERPRKLRTPMCLSRHTNPLTDEEVIARSRPSR